MRSQLLEYASFDVKLVLDIQSCIGRFALRPLVLWGFEQKAWDGVATTDYGGCTIEHQRGCLQGLVQLTSPYL